MMSCHRAVDGLWNLNDAICLSICGERGKFTRTNGEDGAREEDDDKAIVEPAAQDDTATQASEPSVDEEVAAATSHRLSVSSCSTDSFDVPTWGEKVRPISPGSSTVVSDGGDGQDLFVTAIMSCDTAEDRPLGRPCGGFVVDEDDSECDEEGRDNVKATGWVGYIAGPHRKKELGSGGYLEYRCSSIPLERALRSISHAIDADPRAIDRVFLADGCVWRVEMSVGGSASKTFGINIRVCDVDANDGRAVKPTPPRGKEGQNFRVPLLLTDDKQEFGTTQSNQELIFPTSQQHGQVGGPNLAPSISSARGTTVKAGDHVMVMNLLGSGKMQVEAFADLAGEIKSRLIRRELPLWLEEYQPPGSRSFYDNYDLKEKVRLQLVHFQFLWGSNL